MVCLRPASVPPGRGQPKAWLFISIELNLRLSNQYVFAQPGNQSHQESILTPASADSQGFVVQSENEYHPHFVQADKEPDQHRNEMDEDGSSKSLDILGHFSEFID